MEEERLNEAIHGAIFSKNIRKYKEVKDFYKEIDSVDISNVKLDIVNEQKEVFEWVLANPNYDFNALFDNYYLEHEKYGFTNEEFYDYFKIYYNDLLFILDKHSKKEFIIKIEDFE